MSYWLRLWAHNRQARVRVPPRSFHPHQSQSKSALCGNTKILRACFQTRLPSTANIFLLLQLSWVRQLTPPSSFVRSAAVRSNHPCPIGSRARPFDGPRPFYAYIYNPSSDLIIQMDLLGIEPRALRMRSGCDTTTPQAPDA